LGSEQADLSADGRCVAFESQCDESVVPADTNGADDVFVYDRQNGTLERVNLADNDSQSPSGISDNSPSMSDDARFVAFVSVGPTRGRGHERHRRRVRP